MGRNQTFTAGVAYLVAYSWHHEEERVIFILDQQQEIIWKVAKHWQALKYAHISGIITQAEEKVNTKLIFLSNLRLKVKLLRQKPGESNLKKTPSPVEL